MSDQFVAEIRIFPFNFPPTGWAFCDGQILPISQNTALFSLLGTTYGGNGLNTFALPDLQGSLPMQQSESHGAPTGMSTRVLGEQLGTESVTLLVSEIPLHTHTAQASEADGTAQAPGQQLLATGVGVGAYGDPTNLTQLHFQATQPAGGGLPHNNLMPYLALNFCIALQGIFPPRT